MDPFSGVRSPASTTWVSLATGWLLGSAPCATGSCLGLLRTDNAGRSWSAVQAPPALAPATFATGSVHDIRYADPNDGWAFGSDFWGTHDGGATWRRQTLPGVTRFQVESLEASAGRVHAAVMNWDTNRVDVYLSPIGADAWQASGVAMSVGAGPVPGFQLVATGGAAWLIQNNRVVIGGARYLGGDWREWQPPCRDTGGGGSLAAASPTSLAAICNEGTWFNGPQATRLYLSNDGGASFARAGRELPVYSGFGIASPRPGWVVTGAQSPDGRASLLETTNGGASWATVYDSPHRLSAIYLGFTTTTQGVAILSGDGVASLLMTFDGGQDWSPVNLGAGG